MDRTGHHALQGPFIAETLAEFAAQFTFEQIPETVRERAKWLLLDALGLAFAASGHEFARRALAALSGFETGNADVIGFSQKLGLRDAVLMNGTLIHGLDFDDTYFPGSMHVSASCVPTALGMAVHRNTSGKAFFAAYTLGLEVGARLSAAGKGGFIQAGFHATSILGTMACTLIAGRLMQLTAQQITAAQGVALSMTSGTMQPAHEGAATKRLHPGLAGAAAITATAFAEQGYSSPMQTYEGRSGIYRKFLGEYFQHADLGLITAQLGERWETLRTSFKLFPACHQAHAFLNAALELRRNHDVQIADIESIRVLIASAAVPVICEPMAERRKPGSSYAAQFSLPYMVACCIARGKFTLAEIDEAAYTDPVLLALSAKVDYEIDPKSGFPAFRSGEVVVHLKDGRELRQRSELFPDDAPTQAEIVAKFMANTQAVMSAARAGEIHRAVMDIENVDAIGSFAALLRGECA